MGSLPSAARRVLTPNPMLRAAVRSSGRLGVELAVQAGIRHHSKFSYLINAPVLPATAENIKLLEKIADVVRFPREHLFLDRSR